MDTTIKDILDLIKDMISNGATEEELAATTAFLTMVSNFDCDKFFELQNRINTFRIKYQQKGEN